MRYVVEEHQAGAHGVFEIKDIEAGRCLVQPVAVAARVEAQQAADDKPKCGLVRNHQHVFILVVNHDLTDDRQSTRQYADARFAALGGKCEWV